MTSAPSLVRMMSFSMWSTPWRTASRIAARVFSGAMAPENTLAAIRLALRQGADYIENDIMRTKDGRLVITHDLSLARTTDVEQAFPDRTSYQVADYTLAEIKQLDAGSWFGAEFAGQRILTLREWVEAVGSSAGMLLEAKDPWAFPGIETDIDKELRSIPTWFSGGRNRLAGAEPLVAFGQVPGDRERGRVAMPAER